MNFVTINWKTTVAGVVSFLSIVSPQFNLLFDGDVATNPDWNIIVGATTILLGLVAARDADKSSEGEVV